MLEDVVDVLEVTVEIVHAHVVRRVNRVLARHYRGERKECEDDGIASQPLAYPHLRRL
jgi:hypothetical protein